MASATKSLVQSLKRHLKKPWEITGLSDLEYRSALPMATEYRCFCPATALAKVYIPTTKSETVFDYTRDCRRNRPPSVGPSSGRPTLSESWPPRPSAPTISPRSTSLKGWRTTTLAATGTRNEAGVVIIPRSYKFK
ncbi:hypothetical protein MUK42_04031 [Musa troglodytarum]|uniref:Uncharacterized protein n=1 Tax=Musa troglodytarum TaxID=320322 RepID=A0A9E7GB55_9LILI|nr:hypothetical protein MUK42_04031 [Musa troglodytarum]